MRYKLLLILFGIILIAGFTAIYTRNTETEKTNNINMKIGWQTPWAVQGQLTQILKHTDILGNENISAEFKGFTFGAPLNEAALSGHVDVIFTADQPAATLLSKSSDWEIIGRLMYNRVSVYVPPQSPIKTAADLRGMTVAMPFGAAAQRYAYKIQQDSGLNPATDVNNINLDILEQASLVNDKNAVKWGNIDALAGFDPTPAIFEEKGLSRNIGVGHVVSVILMSKSYIASNPDAPEKFLKAFESSYAYYKNNQAQADDWFIKESKLQLSPKALQLSASLEPNLKKDNEIRISFNDSDYKIMQEAANFLYSQKLINKQVNMKEHVNLNYLNKIKGE